MLRAAFILCCFTLVSCSTPYQDMGITGGVQASKMTDDVWRISARGNGYTDRTVVQDYVLLKAAETTIAAGRTHFVVVNQADASSQGTFRTADTCSFSTYGATTFGSCTPGVTSAYVKPGEDVLIRTLPVTASPVEKAAAIDAQQIVRNIGGQVKRAS